MLKRYLLSVVFLFLVTSYWLLVTVVHAAPSYGTHMPEEKHWTCGAEGDFVIDRDLDNEQGATEGNRYFVTASLGVFSWLSLDGKIGVGDVEWKRGSIGDDLSYSTNFAGGYGFRVRLYENEDWGIKSVAGFQHISVHPDPKNQGGIKHETIIDDWQGSLLVSKAIGDLIPYIGGRYGSLDFIKWENEKERKRINSEEYYGLILGMDYWLGESIKLNLEGTFLDGEEIAMGITCDF